MTPSKYQTAIYEWIKSGDGHGAGIAVAGSGKTTTAINGMQFIDSLIETRFMAFGKAIQLELQKRIDADPVLKMHSKAITYNSQGWSIVRKAFGSRAKLDVEKTDKHFKYSIGLNLERGDDRKKYYKHRFLMQKIVSLCKGMAYTTVEEADVGLNNLIYHHDMDVKDFPEFRELFTEVYDRVINDTQNFDFDDQLFVPIKYDLPIPKTDFLIVDEWQDTNVVQYELVRRMTGPSSRILVIGDPDQSIYGFRGTAPDIVPQFINDFQAKKLPLYICYRCSKAAVRNAQQWVPHIEYFEHAKEGFVGNISYEIYKKQVTDDDMVLCRCTAPLVKSVISFIADGRAAYIKGKEYGEALTSLINKLSSPTMKIEFFYDKFNAYVLEQQKELERFNRDAAIEKLQDYSEIMEVLVLGCQTVSDLIKKIESIFTKEGVGICHMTIHKSKGLETTATGSVYSLPYKTRKLKREWMEQEERRLAYVEATRTKNNHYYVMERK